MAYMAMMVTKQATSSLVRRPTRLLDRIATFKMWSGTAALRPLTLAQAGFYLSAPHKLSCSACEFEEDEDACRGSELILMSDHRTRSPNCALLRKKIHTNGGRSAFDAASQQLHLMIERNRAASVACAMSSNTTQPPPGNLLISPRKVHLETPSSGESTEEPHSPSTNRFLSVIDIARQRSDPDRHFRELMKNESNRIQTFFDFTTTSDVRAEDLAAAGFYFIGSNDRTRCIFCNGVLREWEPGDIPRDEHVKHFPNCPFVNGHDVGNVPLLTLQQTMESSNTQRPRMPQCATESGFNRDQLQKTTELQPTAGSPGAHVGSRASTSADLPGNEEESSPQETQEVQSTSKTKKKRKNRKKKLPMTTAEEIPRETSQKNSSSQNSEYASLIAQNTVMREERLCKVCMDDDVAIVFLPCGHLVTCEACAPVVTHCPVCRAYIKGTVRAFL